MTGLYQLLHHHHRQAAVVASLAFATAVCAALLGVRAAYAQSTTHFHLVWNLFLAWLPMVSALLAYNLASHGRRWSRRRKLASIAPCLAFWLLFFPNAPYILTDLLHLRPIGIVPVWYDMLLLIAFAWTGAFLGLVSLYLIQSVVRQAAGRTASWVVTMSVLAVTGFGVYLGRFPRWNSWDLLTNPGALVLDIWSRLRYPWDHPTAIVFSALFSLCLAAMYFMLVAVVQFPSEAEERRPIGR